MESDDLYEPSTEMMLAHVQHIFGGWLDGAHDGLIELAWSDPDDGKLRHAQLFGTDELEDLVERAVEVNRTPGQNAYIGAALRKAGHPVQALHRRRLPGAASRLRRSGRRLCRDGARSLPPGWGTADSRRRHGPASARALPAALAFRGT